MDHIPDGGKQGGLRAHYGIAQAGSAFWDVHASMDADHASWTLDALGALTEEVDTVLQLRRRQRFGGASSTSAKRPPCW